MLFQKEDMNDEQIDGNGKTKKKRQRKRMWDIRYTEKECSLKHRSFRNSPTPERLPFEKVSLCTLIVWLRKKFTCLKRASLTIETALVLPLFFFGMITLISFMDIYKIQTEHLSGLCQKTKEAGMLAYVLEGSGPDEITLPDLYSYHPVGGVIPLPAVPMYNLVKVHAWTGTEHGAGEGEGEAGEEEREHMVLVTESGTVYHKKLNCSHLSLSIMKVSGESVASRRNDQGGKYHACENCSRHQMPGASVYITQSGNRYHNDAGCSGLKRTVRFVKESEVSHMEVCRRCG